MMGAMSRVYSDAEWARRVERRLARLEDPRVLRVGSWALSAGAGGELWADHATTGRRVRLAGPWESSSVKNPDRQRNVSDQSLEYDRPTGKDGR